MPYDKGSNFLLHLERTVGGLDVFLPYVQDYVKTYRNCSITTDTWKAHLMEYFKQHHSGEVFEKLKAVDFDVSQRCFRNFPRALCGHADTGWGVGSGLVVW